MTPRTLIERLEKSCPARSTAGATFEPDFNLRVCGMRPTDAQRKGIQALETAIADPRATPEQRAQWREGAERIRAAILPGE